MSAETEYLLETALKLPEKDRAELAAKLLSSLDGSGDSDARTSWLAEIGQVRRYVFPRYAFILFCRLKSPGIQIVAVTHQQHRPQYWLSMGET